MTKKRKEQRRKQPAAKRWTNSALGQALGLSERQIQRHKNNGMPPLRRGEGLAAWAARAAEWIEAQRKPSGPKPQQSNPNDPDTIAHYVRRFRAARAQLAEIELRVKRGELHTKAECEVETVQRCNALSMHFRRLPSELAVECANKSQDEVLVRAERLCREAIESFIEKARTMEVAAASGDTSSPAAVAKNREEPKQ